MFLLSFTSKVVPQPNTSACLLRSYCINIVFQSLSHFAKVSQLDPPWYVCFDFVLGCYSTACHKTCYVCLLQPVTQSCWFVGWHPFLTSIQYTQARLLSFFVCMCLCECVSVLMWLHQNSCSLISVLVLLMMEQASFLSCLFCFLLSSYLNLSFPNYFFSPSFLLAFLLVLPPLSISLSFSFCLSLSF